MEVMVVTRGFGSVLGRRTVTPSPALSKVDLNALSDVITSVAALEGENNSAGVHTNVSVEVDDDFGANLCWRTVNLVEGIGEIMAPVIGQLAAADAADGAVREHEFVPEDVDRLETPRVGVEAVLNGELRARIEQWLKVVGNGSGALAMIHGDPEVQAVFWIIDGDVKSPIGMEMWPKSHPALWGLIQKAIEGKMQKEESEVFMETLPGDTGTRLWTVKSSRVILGIVDKGDKDRTGALMAAKSELSATWAGTELREQLLETSDE